MATDARIEDWAREMRALLAEVMSQDVGYEIDVQELRPAAASIPDEVPTALRPVYRVFDGLSLPDVHNGYFIDPAARVLTARQRGEPTRIGGHPERAIHAFGSDGGGGRFALGIVDGAVYYLPSGGAVEDGAYLEDKLVRARVVADGVSEFLDLIQRDVRAFAEGREHHRYITDWIAPVPRAD